MQLAAGLALAVATLLFIALALLAVLRIGFGRLESRVGIERDGPRRGRPAPTWRLPDLSGHIQSSPGNGHWQFLLFADHSLASFPALVAGINRIHADRFGAETLIVTRRTAGLDAETAARLGIKVPIVLVDQAFYDRYNVRVMPFAVLLDPPGIVRWASVANYEEQLRRELRLAQAAVAADQPMVAAGGTSA